MQRRGIGTILALALGLVLGGCTRQNETAGGGPPPGAPTHVNAPGPGGPSGPGGPPGTMPGNAAGTSGEAGHTIGQPAANAALTAKVKNALNTTKGLNTSKLNVDTAADGAVTLTGSVPTAGQKVLAEKTAKQIEGVKSVKNELTVAP
jgi:hyperosmotically inducible periplasmic protein